MLRREFIAGLGSAAAWPVVAHPQQRPLMPERAFSLLIELAGKRRRTKPLGGGAL
jgi:hypothetical protein